MIVCDSCGGCRRTNPNIEIKGYAISLRQPVGTHLFDEWLELCDSCKNEIRRQLKDVVAKIKECGGQ